MTEHGLDVLKGDTLTKHLRRCGMAEQVRSLRGSFYTSAVKSSFHDRPHA